VDGVCQFVTLLVAEARGGKSTASKDGLQDQGGGTAEQPYLVGLPMMRKAVLEATPGLSSFRLVLSMLTLGSAFQKLVTFIDQNACKIVANSKSGSCKQATIMHAFCYVIFPDLDCHFLVTKLRSKSMA
jgi:hypothetical protein